MAKTGITINQARGGCLATWKMEPQEFYTRLDLCKNSGNSQNIVESLYYWGRGVKFYYKDNACGFGNVREISINEVREGSMIAVLKTH